MFHVKKFPLKHFQDEKMELDPWFVTGFCVGEASFTYSRTGRGINLYFSLKQKEGDRELVEKIGGFFGVGKIYAVKAAPSRARGGFTRPSAYYRVCKILELERVAEHFDKYPLVGKKADSYRVWKKMFLLKRKFRRPDFDRLQELASQLSDLNS
ncbi:LAGLIDADG family homing endonuclease [candidate division NPL-UPA2 bacterium]|nr:LAGLIDADG family homing endonuclease [candidate division NPL-UPA2 bacterium]